MGKTWLKNLLLLFSSLVVTAIFAEFLLRLVLPSPIVWKFPQEYYDYDSEIGHVLTPKQQTFTHDKVVSTNSLGIRDSEYPRYSAPGVRRVLAIGDSQTFGNGLALSDTWPKRLQSELNQSGDGLHWEVLNSGLPGSDTWQHETIFKRMVNEYNPHIIVLAFYVNDVAKRFVPQPGQQEKTNTLRQRIVYLLKQSCLLLTLRNALNSIQHSLRPSRQFLREQALLKGEYEPGIEQGWKQVEQSILAMKHVSDTRKITFLMASLPRRDQVDGSVPGEAYNERLWSIAERHDIPMVSMLDTLKVAYTQHGKNLFIAWDGHNSAEANQIIGRQIADTLRNLVPQHYVDP